MYIERALLFSQKKQAESWELERNQEFRYVCVHRLLITDRFQGCDGYQFQVFSARQEVDSILVEPDPFVDMHLASLDTLLAFLAHYQIEVAGWQPVN